MTYRGVHNDIPSKNNCRVKDWRGTPKARFQPLPIGTAREVFPQAARPVRFVKRVMCPVC